MQRDYPVSDDDDDNGDTDYDFNEDDESEEDEEDDSCEDDSQIHALIDDLEVKFRQLVCTKIGEAEQFFDDANTLQRPVFHSLNVGEAQVGDLCQGGSQGNPDGVVEVNTSMKNDNPIVIDGGTKGSATLSQRCEIGVQTDEDICSVIKSSGTLVSTENMCNRDESLEPDQARAEIGQLRDVRDSLVAGRQEWAAQLKQSDDKTEDELKKIECKVYEIEEAIEAVDTAIEFKNEIVTGQNPSKSSIGGGEITPGSNEAQLVTRLESLSIEELRRLLCVYFAKVVELRSSSRRLEKNLELAENEIEQLKRRSASDRKYFQTQHEEDVNRIRLFISSRQSRSHPDIESVFRDMHDTLVNTRKKKHHLEVALTELLIRHGYLVNGADYDVKQVVRMLGIESQMPGGGGTSRTTSRPISGTHGGASTSAHHSRSGSQRVTSKPSHHNLSSRRNGQVFDGQFSRLHRGDPMSMMPDGYWEREHRHAQAPTGGAVAEVRRERGRIIIQQNSGAPSSSNYNHAGGGPSNQGGRHHNHHGSSRHGYK